MATTTTALMGQQQQQLPEAPEQGTLTGGGGGMSAQQCQVLLLSFAMNPHTLITGPKHGTTTGRRRHDASTTVPGKISFCVLQ